LRRRSVGIKKIKRRENQQPSKKEKGGGKRPEASKKRPRNKEIKLKISGKSKVTCEGAMPHRAKKNAVPRFNIEVAKKKRKRCRSTNKIPTVMERLAHREGVRKTKKVPAPRRKAGTKKNRAGLHKGEVEQRKKKNGEKKQGRGRIWPSRKTTD